MTSRKEKATILIVDDMPKNIRVLMETLGDEYKMIASKSGESALEKARAAPAPDLILLDIMMPGMDGYEVCRILKEDKITRSIPVIFISAASEPVDEAKAFQLGAVDYVTKPFSPMVVRARVKTHIDLKRKTDQLRELTSIDGLTQIFNRRKFDAMLIQEWKRAHRNGEYLSLLMIDIDHFKQYNDHYGHVRGDECLKQVAGTLTNALKRPGDFLARYGGEEFAAILPKTDLDGAMVIAEQLRKATLALNITHQISSTADCLTISVGVAATQPYNSKISSLDLVHAADKMLYIAKEKGRNRASGVKK